MQERVLVSREYNGALGAPLPKPPLQKVEANYDITRIRTLEQDTLMIMHSGLVRKLAVG